MIAHTECRNFSDKNCVTKFELGKNVSGKVVPL